MKSKSGPVPVIPTPKQPDKDSQWPFYFFMATLGLAFLSLLVALFFGT